MIKTDNLGMPASNRSSLLVGLMAALALLPQATRAANASWTGAGTDALWSNPANWSATPVPVTGNTATFNAAAGAGGTVIDLGAGVTVNTITFTGPNCDAYTIGSGGANAQSLILNGSGNSGLSSGTTFSKQITINAAITVNNTQQWVLNAGTNPWIVNGSVTPNGTAGSTKQIKINGHGCIFNGVLADQAGGAKLQMSGANAQTATLTNPNNSFTGGLLFDNGSVSVNSIGMIGSNSAAGSGGDLLFGSGFGGGTLVYTGTGNTTDRVINFNTGYFGPTINQSGASGLLKFTADVAATAVGSQPLTLTGATAGTGEIAGKIVDNGTIGTTFVKTGASGVTSLVLNSVDGIVVGAAVSGTGIASGTTVTGVTASSRTITLSAATTASVANASLTIDGVKNVTHVTKTGTGTWTLSGANTYSGNTTISAGTLIVNGGLRFAITNSASNKVTGTASVTLNCPCTIDTSAVTTASGSWTLVDTNTLTETFGPSFSLVGFSGPVGNIYTKTSGVEVWTFNKSTGVLSVTSDAVITSFGIPGSTGVINQASKTIALTIPYTPWGVSGLASLAPTFTLTSGTCNQTSGAAPSPTFATTNPVTYTVTDGATVNNYVVTVTIASPSTASAMLTCNFGALGQAVINEAAGTAVLSVSPSQAVTSLAPTFTLSTSASINPASGSTQNFTNPVVYRVTAEDGSTFKDYTVTVQSFASWAYSGSLFIMTTPDGANLPGSASVSDFPLLLRFNSANFNFAQAQANGSDIRFTDAADAPLSYEIEQWDSVNGKAAVWVKIPTITGNARQEIKMYWGKSGTGSQSSGSSVFNVSNGYACVMHLNGNVLDSTGSTSPVNGGATATTALIGGTAMNLSTGDITSAANITNFPAGTNPASSGQVWVRARKLNNWSMPLAWGNKNAYGWNTWNMQIGFWGSPSVLPSPITCRGPAVLSGSTALAANQWYHLAYTNSGGTAKLYVNGVLDGTATGGSLTITNPQALSLGMASGDADVDEARISSVARSADWVKLEYENQKPVQTLVGGIVSAGSDFSVSPTSVTMNENQSTTLTAQAGGAQKVYWIYKKNGQETLLAADQLTLNYAPGRIAGNDSADIQFKAIFAGDTQTFDVPLTVLDTIPEPAFTLSPSTPSWDGRQTMTVTANVSNLAAMQTAGFGTLNYQWSVSGVAVTKQASNGTLALTRSQGSGPMTVTLVMDNGGPPVSQSITINVQEPASDPWLQRTPGATEKPVNGQFFARDPNTGNGTVFYNGTQSGTPDTVYLKVYKTPSGGSETLHATHRQSLVSGTYAFSAPIPAGLVTYRVVYGTTTGGVDTDVSTVSDLVCGDAYIIEGQSNALAIDSLPDELTTDSFVRTYSWTTNTWGLANRKSSEFKLGYWGMDLALYLKSTWSMPICIITGAVGGTRIDQHQPNPANHGIAGSSYSIYANLFNRVTNAKLTHGIRGVFWHQGESNSGIDAGTGDWDYKSYQQLFLEMSAAWKQDFPNIQKYIIFQVQPKPCNLGPKGDQIREVQRTLPRLFSNMSILSTIGIDSTLGYLGCHYTAPGYQKIADLVAPLVERDFYGDVLPYSVTAPNLQRAYYTNSIRDQIALEFDQPTLWNSISTQHFYLDNVAANISSGSHAGNVVTLQLGGASGSSTIDYVQDQKSTWDGNAAKLIAGANTIAALTFADVAIGPAPPVGLSATSGNGQVVLTWTATTGATGYNVKRSTVSNGPYITIATSADPTYTDLSVVGGTPYYYVVSAVNTVGSSTSEGLDSSQATATPPGGYAAWASHPAQGLTAGVNDGLADDPDGDGIRNQMEFVLGGAPMVSSQAPLPTLAKSGESWVFAYNRSVASRPPATTQIVEYSDNLSGWTQLAIPLTSSANVTITPQGETDRVEVVLPPLGLKSFVRLKVSQ